MVESRRDGCMHNTIVTTFWKVWFATMLWVDFNLDVKMKRDLYYPILTSKLLSYRNMVVYVNMSTGLLWSI